MSNCGCTTPKIIQVPADTDFSQLTPAECVEIFQCIIDNGTTAQFIEFLQRFDFTQLTAAQTTAIQDTIGPLFTVNAGTTGDATDDSNGSEIITFNDILHFWSNDGSVEFNVSAGSAIVEAHINKDALNITCETPLDAGQGLITQSNGLVDGVSYEVLTSAGFTNPGTYSAAGDTTFVGGGDPAVPTVTINFDSPVTFVISPATIGTGTVFHDVATFVPSAVRATGESLVYNAGTDVIPFVVGTNELSLAGTGFAGVSFDAPWGEIVATNVTSIELDIVATDVFNFEITAIQKPVCEIISDLRIAQTGLQHTAITAIDLQPTANPNEFTVVISWTDSDGVAQTTTDATPVTISGTSQVHSIATVNAAFDLLALPPAQPQDAPTSPNTGDTHHERYSNGHAYYEYNGTSWVLTIFQSNDDRKFTHRDESANTYTIGSLAGPLNPPADPVQSDVHMEYYENAIVFFSYQASGVGAGWDGNNATIVPLGGSDAGTVETATAALTTTNGVSLVAGDFYVSFPDGTTWATEDCSTVVGPFSHPGITGLNTNGQTSEEWSEFYPGAATVGFGLTGTVAAGGGYVSLQVGTAPGLSDIFDGDADGFNANDVSSAGGGGGNFVIPSSGTYYYRLIRSGSTNLGGTAQNNVTLNIAAVTVEASPCEFIAVLQQRIETLENNPIKTINIECYEADDYTFTFNRNDEPSVTTTTLFQLESNIEFYAGPVAIPLEGVLVELTNTTGANVNITATVEDLDTGTDVAAASLVITPGTNEYFFPFPGLLVGNNNAEGYDILWSGDTTSVTLNSAAGDDQSDGNFFALQGVNTPQVAWVSAIIQQEIRVVTCSNGDVSAYDANDVEVDISGGIPTEWIACDPLPERAAGTTGHVLTSNGPGAEPTWQPVPASSRAGGYAGFSSNDGGAAGTILTPDAGQIGINNSGFTATFWAPFIGQGGVKVGTVYKATIHGVATAGSAGTLAAVEVGAPATRHGSITVDAATGNFSGEVWFTATDGTGLAFIVDTGTVNIVAGQTFVSFEEMNA